ncbi:MAG TPA: DUF4920 domain-containing protein [Cyclobacteriaceae bacterium]|nr:DUF4920 domain-containing protein [Cyclobacteriaceae bacterium]
MRKYFLILVAATLLAACAGKQETTVEEQSFNTYGEVISAEGAQSLAVLDEKLTAENDSVYIKVKATIDKTCEKKGCWMVVEDESGNEVRVTFKDYGFFVPTAGVEGKEVIFAGYAYRKTTEVDLLKHFAEDAGKSQEEIDAITEPKVELTFVADGVIIFEKEEQTEE